MKCKILYKLCYCIIYICGLYLWSMRIAMTYCMYLAIEKNDLNLLLFQGNIYTDLVDWRALEIVATVCNNNVSCSERDPSV